MYRTNCFLNRPVLARCINQFGSSFELGPLLTVPVERVRNALGTVKHAGDLYRSNQYRTKISDI